MGLGSPAQLRARSALMPIKRIFFFFGSSNEESGGPVSPWLIVSLFLAFLFANDEYGGPVSPCIIFPLLAFLFAMMFVYTSCVVFLKFPCGTSIDFQVPNWRKLEKCRTIFARFLNLWTCEKSSLYCHVPFFPFWLCLLNTTNYWTITYWSWSKLVSFLPNLPWFLIKRFISFWIFFKTYFLLNKVDMAMFTFFYSLVNRKTLFFCLRNRSWNRFFNFNFLLLDFFSFLKERLKK